MDLDARDADVDVAPGSGEEPAPGRGARSQGRVMDRRSWYMPRSSAEDLAAVVDELYFTTRQPKHAVLAALVTVAVNHAQSAAAALRGGAAPGEAATVEMDPGLHRKLSSWAVFAASELGTPVTAGDVVGAVMRRLTMTRKDPGYDEALAPALIDAVLQDLRGRDA